MIYSCMVQDSGVLLWTYTSNGSTLPYIFSYDSVTTQYVLGPLELELTSVEETSESVFDLISTATFASGLTAAEEGAVISCGFSNSTQGIAIFFAGE